jgi:hypothetical protein
VAGPRGASSEAVCRGDRAAANAAGWHTRERPAAGGPAPRRPPRPALEKAGQRRARLHGQLEARRPAGGVPEGRERPEVRQARVRLVGAAAQQQQLECSDLAGRGGGGRRRGRFHVGRGSASGVMGDGALV